MTLLNHASKGLLTTLALTGMFAFSSCSKDDDDTTVDPDATVKIVNVLPDAGPVDIYNGSSKLNSSTIAYGEATPYLSVKDGDARFDFKSTATGNTVLSTPVDFDGGSYSLFAAGETDGNATAGILVKDDLKGPASGKAKVRFVHAGSNAPTVNFLLNDAVIVNSAGYKSASEFREVDAGTYTLKLNNASSGETAITRDGIVMEAGKIYTVVAQGLLNNTPILEQPLTLSVLTNN